MEYGEESLVGSREAISIAGCSKAHWSVLVWSAICDGNNSNIPDSF